MAGENQSFEAVRGAKTYALDIVPVRDEQGSVTAGVALVYDVTSHKQTEAMILEQTLLVNEEAASVEILQTIAAAANNAFRASDVVVRLGGDEVVALLPEANAEQLGLFAARIDAEISARNQKPGQRSRLSASVGGTAHDSAQPESIEALLVKADALMYEQKRARKALLDAAP